MQAFFSYNDRIKTILEDTTMKVSVIQMNMRSLESKANFDRAEALVRRAVGENGRRCRPARDVEHGLHARGRPCRGVR